MKSDVKKTRDKILKIAKVCHEVNAAFCASMGDKSQSPTWEDAPGWQKQSCIDGVSAHLSGKCKTPEQSHENWLAHKVADGWTYGQEKDAEKRTHPCMVPYSELPLEQRQKDYIFAAICHAMKSGVI